MDDILFLHIGEDKPFLRPSKKTFERLSRALLLTGSSLTHSLCLGEWSDRSASFIASVEVPAAKRELFESLLGTKTSYHPSIILGHTMFESQKWRSRDGVKQLSLSKQRKTNLE